VRASLGRPLRLAERARSGIGEGKKLVRFAHAIIAAGSQAVKLPGLPWDDKRLMDSTDALDLTDVPKRLLVVGGGIIGLEMACVYDALGSEVTVVEFSTSSCPAPIPIWSTAGTTLEEALRRRHPPQGQGREDRG
jgi:pyruvate/2-oxoglutarate dehydrogenase complex dihydrolipoamide dehydrogenase (E3) component